MITPEMTRIDALGQATLPSPLQLSTTFGDGVGDYVPEAARVRYQVETGTGSDLPAEVFFEKAGPRERIFFNPAETRAAIVTCGGLCPGLNNVIRSAFLEFHHNYGVPEVLGIRYGYAGLNPQVGQPPLKLTADFVDHIHEVGGTVLGTSRGPQPPEVMVDFLAQQKINILLCVGGDGTLRGAQTIALEARKRGLRLVVVGIPKTIDNDVMYVSRTFGVLTAADKAREVLTGAHNEAKSAFSGVGLVKVMGRNAGFVAAVATLASQEVNFTLIPEVPFALEGDNGLLMQLEKRLAVKGHALIAVAEGAGQNLLNEVPERKDESGNVLHQDIGLFLRGRMIDHFKRRNIELNMKYIDPSYIIRSVAANSEDAVMCDMYARNAVHAAMAGKTDVVIGYWHDFIHVPISMATEARRKVSPDSLLWNSVLSATGQRAVMI